MATTTRTPPYFARTPPLNPKLRTFSLTPQNRRKHTFFGANTMFFSSIPGAICKSETYLSHAQNLCRKHP